MLASFPSLAWGPPPNSIPTVALLPGLRLACLMTSPCSLDFCDSTRVSIIYWLVRAQPPYSWLLSRLMRSMPGKPVLQQDHGVRVGPRSVATHTGQRNWTNEVPRVKPMSSRVLEGPESSKHRSQELRSKNPSYLSEFSMSWNKW